MKFNFKVADRDGVLPVAKMRELFERSVAGTERFRKAANLTPRQDDTGFCGYEDPETDTLWLGFAIGLRCAERLERGIVKP